MKTTRRTFLAQAGAVGPTLALGGACGSTGGDSASPESSTPTRAPEPPVWAPEGEEDTSAFPWGIQTGDATDDGIVVSVKTSEEAFRIEIVEADGDLGWIPHDTLDIDAHETSGTFQTTVGGLRADTAYSVAAFSLDGSRRSRPSRFRTALGGADDRIVVFGATSCLGGNAPWPSLSHAAAAQLDFFLLLGDTVYADNATSLDGYRGYWDDTLRTAGLRDLTSSTSIIATWDDHEVGDGWSWDDDGIEERFDAALTAFTETLPRRAGGGVAGVWRGLQWGDVLEIFVLDCRSERGGDAAPSQFLGPDQIDFLKAGLEASDARFKLIMNPVPMSDYTSLLGDALAHDRWQGFPEQRSELLEHIREREISGVFLVSGDFHTGQVSMVDSSGGPGDNLPEILAGPSGSTLNPLGFLEEYPDPFLLFVGAWTCCIFTLDPGAGSLLIQFVDDDGLVVGEMEATL